MPYRVLLTRDAMNDLEELDTWIATHDSPEAADYVLDRISEAFQKLSELPELGTYPKELSVLALTLTQIDPPLLTKIDPPRYWL